jgi:prevent-host-death family protein
MRNYPLYRDGSVFSQLIDRTPAGEPQRLTSHATEAVVVVSDAGWFAWRKSSPILSGFF